MPRGCDPNCAGAGDLQSHSLQTCQAENVYLWLWICNLGGRTKSDLTFSVKKSRLSRTQRTDVTKGLALPGQDGWGKRGEAH